MVDPSSIVSEFAAAGLASNSVKEIIFVLIGPITYFIAFASTKKNGQRSGAYK